MQTKLGQSPLHDIFERQSRKKLATKIHKVRSLKLPFSPQFQNQQKQEAVSEAQNHLPPKLVAVHWFHKFQKLVSPLLQLMNLSRTDSSQ